MLRTHCCRHKCFPVFPRAQQMLRTQILCSGHKNVSDFAQKHFVSAENVPSLRAQGNIMSNNVSSFASTFRLFNISAKKHEDYATTISWIRAKVSFAILRSALLCLRGSRTRRRRINDIQDRDLEVENGLAGLS